MIESKMKFDMSEGELHAMSEVWANPGAPTKVIAFNLYQKFDWAPGTSYTVLTRCVKKGFADKDEKGQWYPIISKEDVQVQRLKSISADLYNGSAVDMACALISGGFIAPEEMDKLKQTMAQME